MKRLADSFDPFPPKFITVNLDCTSIITIARTHDPRINRVFYLDLMTLAETMGAARDFKVNIPLIDISSKNKHASFQLLSAAADYGFVFIENNDLGIPPSDIDRLFELSRQFFASPVEMKEDVAISSNKAGKNHGWLSRGIELLDPATQKRADVKE